MSTATQTPPSDSSRYVDYDEFIDFQVQKTRAGIKTNDLLTALIGGSVAVLAYVLAFAVFDHWIIDGGFSRGMRFALLGLLVTGLCIWSVWKLVLPYFRKVSALYAAREIEQTDPQFRSTLITLVDLKQAGRKVSPEIRAVLEKRAGLGLTHMDVEQAVDRRPLMRLSYVLLGLVVVTCLYTVFSPKKLSNSLWRALLPTAAVAVDTRTEIDRVQPGDVEVLARAQLEVTADLSGEMPEEVTLLYSTSDNRLVDEPIAMREVDEGLRQYRGVITGENGRGILQNLTYRVVAGDATSPSYSVTVKQPPSATVDEVHFSFPKYMQFVDRTQTGGAIDSWEGVEVTVRATANMPIASAMVKFSDTEDLTTKAEELPLKVENGNELTATWRLQIRSDGTYPNFYRMHVVNDAGEEDPNPTLHPIKITPDRRPEIQLAHPTGDIERPANAIVPLLFAARDPDFKLRAVVLHIEQNGEKLPQAPRLFEAPPEQQSISDTYQFDLGGLDVKPGDRVTYWLEARDNMEPFGSRSGNRTNTPRLNITILEPASQEEVQQQLEEDQQQIQDRLEEAKQDPQDEGMPPQQQDGSADEDTPPPPANEEQPQEDGEAGEPTEAGEPSEAGGEQGSEGQSIGSQQQQGTGQRQSKQAGDQSQSGGEQQNRENGEGSGEQSSDDAPFEEVLDKLMRQQKEREQQQGANGQQQREPQEGEGQPQKNPSQSGEQQQSPGQQSGEPGESGTSQSGESGESQSQPGDSSASESPSNDGHSENAASDSNTSQSRPSDSTQPSDSRGERSSGGEQRKSGDSRSASENAPTENGRVEDGEQVKREPSEPTGAERRSEEPADPDGQPTQETDPNASQSRPGDPMSGEPQPGQPNDSATESQNRQQTPDGNSGQAKPAGDANQSPASDATDPSGGQQSPKAEDSQQPMPANGETTNESSDPTQSPQTGEAPEGAEPTDSEQSRPGENTSKGEPTSESPPSDSQPMPGSESGESSSSESSQSPGSEGMPPAGDQQSPGQSPSGESSEGQQEGAGGKPPSEQSGGEGQSGEQDGMSEGGSSVDSPSENPSGSGSSSDQAAPGSASESPQPGQGGGNFGQSEALSDSPAEGEAGEQTGDGAAGEGGGAAGDNIQGDAPDLENKRKAANLVLEQLEDQIQRGDLDPEMLEELGVSEDRLKDFTRKLRERLADTGEDTSPEAKARRLQFQETLRNLNTNSTGTTREGGERPRESASGFGGQRQLAPARYRDAAEAYRKLLNARKKSSE